MIADTESNTLHQDSAGKLLDLIKKILKTKNKPGDKNSNSIQALPLGQTFEKIAELVGMNSYLELLTNFVKLCDGTKIEIELLDLNRESVRTAWLNQIDEIGSVFNASNFELKTSQVFGRHFSENNLNSLDMISERFVAARNIHSSKETLSDAFSIISDTISEFEKSGKISGKFSRLFQLHARQLEKIIEHYDDFGESDFWETYKIIFATFMQLHDTVVDDENKDTINEKMRAVLNKIVITTSLGANAVTLGAAALPLLT